jgi:dynein heavy chain
MSPSLQWKLVFAFWGFLGGGGQLGSAASLFSGALEAIEALPLANTPEVFGLHSNAEIGYYTQAARDMWSHLLELQPQTGKCPQGSPPRSGPQGVAQALLVGTGDFPTSPMPSRELRHRGLFSSPTPCFLISGESSSGVSRDDYIGQVAKDIENKMPKVFDLDQVRKHLGHSISPTSVVLLQELGRFNKLVVRMSKSLAELQRVSAAVHHLRGAAGGGAPGVCGRACLPDSAHRPWLGKSE